MAEGHPATDPNSAAISSNSSEEIQQVIYRKDYEPPAFLIEKTDLLFELDPKATVVTSTLQIRRNPDAMQSSTLRLDGHDTQLLSVSLNGVALSNTDYELDEHSLSLTIDADQAELVIVTQLAPADNLALEGLYQSEGTFCTQCEAEGFRRITYYLDRPDVLSLFTTKIVAPRDEYPVLLSNGNNVANGVLDDGRHWVEWHDPFKKPCYLFALVAGELDVLPDKFTTASGRVVELRIYAKSKDIDKCHHAMRSLKRSMRWDEEVYGREYDLDLYMIVAVDFFNMGAMENKGLNIFNTSCVLAHPETQTDAAFQRVEAVIAHEYFHNWSGNRVTCRDWFQLSLKEGFTVFRDACFSADMNSATVKRIEDVNLLRSAQFAEDAGPLAHPVRPDSFIEISNFYTLTIYEKGAEVIRMMHRLLGPERFRKGADLYFARHDGQAVTCEDFVVAMEDASGVDLRNFRHWYEQAGTPQVQVESSWDQHTKNYTLTFTQSCDPTPGQDDKPNFTIPVDFALLSGDMQSGELLQEMLVLEDKITRISFDSFDAEPIPSFLRGFSAPVTLSYDYTQTDLLHLVSCETDGFARWDASRRFWLKLVSEQLSGHQDLHAGTFTSAAQSLADCLLQLIHGGFVRHNGKPGWSEATDAELLAEMLKLPSYTFVLQHLEHVDVIRLCDTLDALEDAWVEALGVALDDCYQNLEAILQQSPDYRPEAGDIALRSLKNNCLQLMLKSATDHRIALTQRQFQQANNMTDQYTAIQAVVHGRSKTVQTALDQVSQSMLASFYQQWQDEGLVVNQWLDLQASANRVDSLYTVRQLQQHAAYDNRNPNKVRSLVAAFAQNSPRAFHSGSGEGYQLLADEVLRLDPLNPQLAARLVTPLSQWQKYSDCYAGKMQQQLDRILMKGESAALSSDVYEVVSKALVKK